MRISDWSSDVCSSDLHAHAHGQSWLQAARNIEHRRCRTRFTGKTRRYRSNAGFNRAAIGQFDDSPIARREPLRVGRTYRRLDLYLRWVRHAEQLGLRLYEGAKTGRAHA